MYSPVTKRHLLTADTNEVLTLSKTGVWNYEGASFKVTAVSFCSQNESVYRFYSEALRTHLYTADENEKNSIIKTFNPSVWNYEGVTYCASSTKTDQNQVPVYRFYSQVLKTHLYTIDENEKSHIIATFDPSVWAYEGIAYYAYPK
jgi:hypothetical protein